MSAETLQRVFKTLADPTRLRLLRLLEREELAVGELMQVLGMAQSTVSRHLGILREAGLIQDRREGTFVYYRLALPNGREWQAAWELARGSLRDDPLGRRDAAALEAVFRARATRARDWFDSVGPEWDLLRKIFNDDAQRARAIAKLVPADLTVADIGTGTGILAAEMARCGLRVVAVDHSEAMLEAARANVRAAQVTDLVELRHGEADALPLSDGEVDAAFAHMVLQYLARPQEAISEMARVVRPGGHVVLVDFVQHDRDWMQRKLGALWQGFPTDVVEAWLSESGLALVSVEIHPPESKAAELPATFIASARRPSSGNGR